MGSLKAKGTICLNTQMHLTSHSSLWYVSDVISSGNAPSTSIAPTAVGVMIEGGREIMAAGDSPSVR